MLWLTVAVVLWVLTAAVGWALCRAAARGERMMEEMGHYEESYRTTDGRVLDVERRNGR